MADGRIIIDTLINDSGAVKGLKGLGSKMGSIAKTGATALAGLVASASAAVTAIATVSIKQYAEYEQLVGGVETLFKKSSDQVMKYANNAYKTAGLSANEYMSTITGFSASLLQGLGGDTKKAAQIGNKAVTDMSDNANKMGTDMQSIQNAYQGFAKQNYTMLDNLKLGYGGTKEEMQRLLKDAEKLSGMKYSIGNFSDIIEAIHVVQGEMGITGTTAKEASETIEGSFNMLKASWSNVLVAMADDNANFGVNIGDLVSSIQTFGENILPRIKIVLDGVGQLFSGLATQLPSLINAVLPELLNSGINIITNLLTGIQSQLPQLATTAMEIIGSLTNAIITTLPQLLQMGMQIIVQLAMGIGQQLPTLIPLAIQCIMEMVNTLISNLPLILNAGLQLLEGLATGIVNAIPMLISMLPRVIQSIVNFISQSLPQILQSGLTILLALIDGIVQCIPQLIAMLPQVINTILTFITQNLPQIIEMGVKVLLALINGLVNAIPQLINMLPQIINTIVNTLMQNLPQIIKAGIDIILALIKGLIQSIPTLVANIPQIIMAIFNAITLFNWASAGQNVITKIGQGLSSMKGNIGGIARGIADGVMGAIKGIFSGGTDIGINLVKGLWNGIDSMKNWVIGLVKGFANGVISSIKGIFGIHSPSRVMRDLIGKNIVKGIGVGVELETPNLEDDIEGNMEDLIGKMKATVGMETIKTASMVDRNNSFGNNTITNNDNGITQNVTIVNPERTPSENARALKKVGRDLVFGY